MTDVQVTLSLPVLKVGWTLCLELLFYIGVTVAIASKPWVPLVAYALFLLGALTALPAFQAFASGVKDRCVEPPRRVTLTKIGAYGFFGA